MILAYRLQVTRSLSAVPGFDVPITRRATFMPSPCRAFVPDNAAPIPSMIEATDALRIARCRILHASNPDRAQMRPDTDKDAPSMATLDAIQARLSAEIDRMVAARMSSTQTGPGQDGDWAATLADEIEARLMQPASPAEEDETPATWTGLLQDGESMPTLTDEIKTFIVKGLACYDTPSQVAEAVKANFNIEITRQHVYAYDPGASQQMAPRWKELHAATRQAFLRETAEIGIAHRAVRLRKLDRLASRCERNSVALALKCLEIAAKESGGLYENRKPVLLQPTLPQTATPEPPAPQPAAIGAVTPQPPAPRPSAPPPVTQQPSLPALAVPQPLAVPAQTPQPPALTAHPSALTAQPPALPAQPAALPAQPPALPEGRPLSREERYLAYVRDRNARDRAVAAEALLVSGRGSPAISAVPPAS
jgi:hypothetical protein